LEGFRMTAGLSGHSLINTLRRLSVLIFNSVTGEILYVELLIIVNAKSFFR